MGAGKPASNGRGMIDDVRLWGSRRWNPINAPPKKPRWRTWVARDFDNPNASLSEGEVLAVVVGDFPVASCAIEVSVMGVGEGSGGGDGGPGENSPRSGVRRGEAPRQPQCNTLGRLAPRHYALRRRPRCPRLAPGGAPHERGAVVGSQTSAAERRISRPGQPGSRPNRP